MPLYQHNCSSCKFLESVSHYGQKYDLYRCGPSFLIRWSNRPYDSECLPCEEIERKIHRVGNPDFKLTIVILYKMVHDKANTPPKEKPRRSAITTPCNSIAAR